MSIQILNRYYPVLDWGFVALKDFMGSDEAIEEAARVSYGAGTRKKTETRGLIRYLMRHRHTTPFEMVELKFHIGLPIFVARQWIRHRTANVNEYSGRYSLMPMLFYYPEQNQCCTQSSTNNQGRTEDHFDDKTYHVYGFNTSIVRNEAKKQYEWCNEHGMARELARIDLPLSMYTYWYWKIDLHNLFHFLTLRCDEHAQWEIRQYANIMAGIVKRICPLAFEAWVDYCYGADNWTRLDKELNHHCSCMGVHLRNSDIEEKAEELGMSNREIEEYHQKCLPIQPPSFDLPTESKDAAYFEEIINNATKNNVD